MKYKALVQIQWCLIVLTRKSSGADLVRIISSKESYMALNNLQVKAVEGLLGFKKPSDTHLVHEKLFSFNVTFVKS